MKNKVNWLKYVYIFICFGYDILVFSENDDCMLILLLLFVLGFLYFLILLEVNGFRYDIYFFKNGFNINKIILSNEYVYYMKYVDMF